MGRKRTNIKISPYLRDFLQSFADNQATIRAINTYFKEPECGELTEGMYCWAETVCDKLCSELNIIGEVDKDIIKALYNECENDNELTEKGKLFKAKDGE